IPRCSGSWCNGAAPTEAFLTYALLFGRSSCPFPNPKAAQLVKLHCFAGLTVEQAAEALELSRSNAYRLWTFARAWLYSHGQRPGRGCLILPIFWDSLPNFFALLVDEESSKERPIVSIDFAQMQEIFLAAVERHRPEDWQAYLDQACGADHELRHQVG